jgi:hypothetical protein
MLHRLHFSDCLPRKLIVLAALFGIAGTLVAAELVISRVSHRPLNIRPADLGGVVQYGPNGSTYFLHTGRGIVHRIGDAEASLVSVPLEPAPESANAEVSFMDMAIDSRGQMFLAAIWTQKPKGGGAGVLVYDAAGHYQRTIVLKPQVSIRHLAMDAAGNLFVLGIDPAYFKGFTNLCALVHKYTPDGQRVLTFSGCPIPTGERAVTGPPWEQLSFEVDRGSIWIQDGRLYQVLPAGRAVRVFDSVTGIALSETSLHPPPSDGLTVATGPSVAWRVVPLGERGYLVVWSVPTTMGRTSFVSAHDRNGAPTTGWNAPLRVGMPVAAAPNGNAFVLAPERDGTVSLLRGTVRAE